MFVWELAPDILTHTHSVELSNHDYEVKTLDGFSDGTFQEIGPGRPQPKDDTQLATVAQSEPVLLLAETITTPLVYDDDSVPF